MLSVAVWQLVPLWGKGKRFFVFGTALTENQWNFLVHKTFLEVHTKTVLQPRQTFRPLLLALMPFWKIVFASWSMWSWCLALPCPIVSTWHGFMVQRDVNNAQAVCHLLLFREVHVSHSFSLSVSLMLNHTLIISALILEAWATSGGVAAVLLVYISSNNRFEAVVCEP